MKQFLIDTQATLTYWKFVIFKVFNGFLLVIAATFLAATDGVDWAAFTTFQKWKLAVFCFVAGGKYLEGFFDQTLSKMDPQEPTKKVEPKP